MFLVVSFLYVNRNPNGRQFTFSKLPPLLIGSEKGDRPQLWGPRNEIHKENQGRGQDSRESSSPPTPARASLSGSADTDLVPQIQCQPAGPDDGHLLMTISETRSLAWTVSAAAEEATEPSAGEDGAEEKEELEEGWTDGRTTQNKGQMEGSRERGGETPGGHELWFTLC